MNFLKQVLATIVGLTIFQIISLVITLIFISAIIASFAGKESTNVVTEVKDDSVLYLDFSNDIPEKDGYAEFNFSNFEDFSGQQAGLQTIIDALSYAKSDDRIKGAYINLSFTANSYSTIELLRDAITDFKSSGKFTIAYGEMVDQKSYYLATACDKLYLNSQGYLELRGVGAQLTFYRKLLEEKLDAEVQVFKVGNYKSAVEPFILDKMSEDNRNQITYLLSGVKEDLVHNIANARNMSEADVDKVFNQLLATNMDSCLQYNLIDDVKYYDEIISEIKGHIGLDKDEDVETVGINEYALAVAQKGSGDDKIAVIYAEGEIVDGKGDVLNIGGEKFAKIIREIRNDDEIDAVVLRVNSPGGSALASEVMWRELELLKAEKPLVVSMGELAASGGYYISCNADKIYAEDNTITGSIGVFGMIPNMENFFNNKLGVTFDEVNLNEHATFNGVTKKLDDFEGQTIQARVDNIYEVFTTRVAEGRDMDINAVLEVAGGRVWTGEQALERGLVDEVGTLSDAIAYAVELAELNDFTMIEYPKTVSPFEMFLNDMKFQTSDKFIKTELNELYPVYQEWKNIEKNTGVIQAKLPFIIEIQ